jgi:hypothetical protein
LLIGIFPLNSCDGKTKIPLDLMNRFKSASIPVMQVVVLLIVHLWYGSDSKEDLKTGLKNEYA